MKYLFVIVIALHGLVHLPGFLKAFRISEFEQLHSYISKPAGVFWLLATLLFFAAALLFLLKSNTWPVLAITATLLSAILIVLFWKDAKFGMIPNVIILVVALASLSSIRLDRKIDQERQIILSQISAGEPAIFGEDAIRDLPDPVKDWLRNSGVVGKTWIKSVSVRQKAQMKMKPGQEKWAEAEAEQYVTTEKPAFLWTVRMNMSSLIKVRGRDKFMDGKGHMLIRMNSLINFVNETGEKLSEGSLQRYLGEIVWYPTMAASPYITWEAIDDHSARARLSYQGTTGSGIFYFDGNGDFVKFTAMRYKGNEPDAKKYPWIITADEYATFDGIRVPVSFGITWELEDGEWTWLKMQIVDLKYNTPVIQ
jgi:hypothetical protein